MEEKTWLPITSHTSLEKYFYKRGSAEERWAMARRSPF
jgi:hypothetical protein